MLRKFFGTLGRAIVYAALILIIIAGVGASIAFPPAIISVYFGLTGGWALLVLSGWAVFLTALGVAILENYNVE